MQCSEGGGTPGKLPSTLAGAYDADNMTGVMVVDTPEVICLQCSELGTPGKLFSTLADAYDADIMTGVMVVDTH